MLFRQSKTIHADEIKKAIQPQASHHTKKLEPEQLHLAEQLAENLLGKILSGQYNFWEAIYQPYAKQELTREVVIKLIEKARAEGATSMPKLARLLGACDPADESAEERKNFYRFKNFFYKTVRIE
jgi:hypothetical protein